MPLQIYRRQQAPDDSIAKAITGASQGFIQGRQLRNQTEDRTLANAYKRAQIDEIKRKTGALNQPAPAGYTRDPYSGKLVEDLSYNPYQPQGQESGGGFGGGNAPILKDYKIGHKTYANPAYEDYKLEQKRKENEMKPLSDTASTRLSAAEQALGNIQTVKDMTKPETFENLKSGFGKIRVANKLGINNPESVRGNIVRSIPVVGQLAQWGVRTTDDQKNFENNLSTLIEGQLRARTGAAAPQSEVDREVSRILASDDSIKSFLGKLSNSEKFVLGIANGIRPGKHKTLPTTPRNSDVSTMSEEELNNILNS